MSLVPSFMVVRQLELGDVILATPIIRQLYQDHAGQCDIDVLTMRPEVFQNSPFVRRIYTPKNFSEVKGPYTRVINLDLAHENRPRVHAVDAYALTSHGTVGKIEARRLELFPSDADRLRAKSIQAEDIVGDFLVIHFPNDAGPSRNLPDLITKKIIDILLEFTDLKIAQIGSARDTAFINHPRLVSLDGGLNIHELREIIASAKCFIGVESSTFYIAACTDTPIISMFSSTHHRLREPLERPPHARFIAIQPQVDCYGCEEHYKPPVTGLICHRGNANSPPCKDMFDLDNIHQSLIDLGLATPLNPQTSIKPPHLTTDKL